MTKIRTRFGKILTGAVPLFTESIKRRKHETEKGQQLYFVGMQQMRLLLKGEKQVLFEQQEQAGICVRDTEKAHNRAGRVSVLKYFYLVLCLSLLEHRRSGGSFPASTVHVQSS